MEQIAGLDKAEIPVCLSHVFANLIGMQLENALLKDLLEEGRLLYKDSGLTVLFDAVAHTLGYLQSGRNPSYLEPLQPDVALAVAAMAAEVNASSIS